MLVLAVLIPTAVVGLIIWLVVGLRQRAAEPFTLASATAFYSHLMVILTATAALCGGVLLVKATFGFWNSNYSYGFRSFRRRRDRARPALQRTRATRRSPSSTSPHSGRRTWCWVSP